jgi:phospholipase C
VTRRSTLAIVLGGVIAAALGQPARAADSASDRQSRTPIEHFIVLMQENHSFDNYFGTYPGADGIPKGTCMPIGASRAAKRPGQTCLRPFHLGRRAAPELVHDHRTQRIQYANGRMDGFVRGASVDRQNVERSVMGYYDDRDVPFYWNLARAYVLFDRFFAAAPDGSVANHLFWVTGTPGPSGPAGENGLPQGDLGDLPTIFDTLEERGISWKFYVQDYDPPLGEGAADSADSVQSVRVPLLGYSRYRDDPRLFSHIVDLDQYYEDLETGRLPAVAYIAPAGASEHPPGRLQAGQTLVRTLISALARSTAWDSSAFMLTYDEWGGWFDHVRPPGVDGATYGFRVPALLVSPYARRDYVDSTQLDTTSILRFIEDNWGLEPLARRDARANSFRRAFNFSRPPREPTITAAARGAPAGPEPRRIGIYLAYGAAVVLTLILIGCAALPGPRRRRRRATFDRAGVR